MNWFRIKICYNNSWFEVEFKIFNLKYVKMLFLYKVLIQIIIDSSLCLYGKRGVNCELTNFKNQFLFPVNQRLRL